MASPAPTLTAFCVTAPTSNRAGLLKVLDDWRDPEFQRIVAYVRNELPQKLLEPGFLDDLEHVHDQEKHPELAICAWYEQIGSYMKHGLLDETTCWTSRHRRPTRRGGRWRR